MEPLPKIIPIFPLARVLLLPGGTLPLVIFESRYLAMLNDALAGTRLLGIIQPKKEGEAPPIYDIGCVGRITSFNEIGGSRMLITLTGLSRFEVMRELKTSKPFRQIEASYENFTEDLESEIEDEERIDRDGLLSVLRRYLKQNHLQADWDAINQASSTSLVTALCILSPYGVMEKQALLEAISSVERCALLIALTEMALAEGEQGEMGEDSPKPTIQ